MVLQIPGLLHCNINSYVNYRVAFLRRKNYSLEYGNVLKLGVFPATFQVATGTEP